MLLAEELALVAIRPDTGRHAVGGRPKLNACLAGLLVAELHLEGAVTAGHRKNEVTLLDRPVTASPALSAAARVVAEKGPRIRTILSHMNRWIERNGGRGTWEVVVSGLVRTGVLAPASGGVRRQNDVIDAQARQALIDRLRIAAEGDGAIEPRTALVLNMTGPAYLLEDVAPVRATRKHARRRVDRALDGTDYEYLGKAVRRVLADDEEISGFTAGAAGAA